MYTYLLINFFTIVFPFALSFDKKVAFYKKWKALLPATIISATLFIVWDIFFTILGVWSFNPKYLSGLFFSYIPIEEVLFFITIPYACVFVYECVIAYLPKDYFAQYKVSISIFLLLLSVVILALFTSHLYTLYTHLGLICLWIILYLLRHTAFLGRFYLAFLISIVPFLIVNGILTSLPIVMYNDLENMGIRIYTIPLDDFFYGFLLLLLNVSIYEKFKKYFKCQ